MGKCFVSTPQPILPPPPPHRLPLFLPTLLSTPCVDFLKSWRTGIPRQALLPAHGQHEQAYLCGDHGAQVSADQHAKIRVFSPLVRVSSCFFFFTTPWCGDGASFCDAQCCWCRSRSKSSTGNVLTKHVRGVRKFKWQYAPKGCEQ